MPKCPCCEDGRVVVEEDGKRIVDACYHCGETGEISEEAARQDKIHSAVCTIASRLVQYDKLACNAMPEGEGWAFAAAENMMHEHEYTMAKEYVAQVRVQRILEKIEDQQILDCIVELILQEPAKTFEWFQRRWDHE